MVLIIRSMGVSALFDNLDLIALGTLPMQSNLRPDIDRSA